MTDDIKKPEWKGGTISLAIGAPIGLAAILYTIFLPEDLAVLGMVVIYGYGIIAFTLSFLLALWYAGKKAVRDLLSKKKLLLVSFRYSLFVNTVIWVSFAVVTTISNMLPSGKFSFIFIVPQMIGFIICVAATPFTIGLVICLAISRSIKIKTT